MIINLAWGQFLPDCKEMGAFFSARVSSKQLASLDT